MLEVFFYLYFYFYFPSSTEYTEVALLTKKKFSSMKVNSLSWTNKGLKLKLKFYKSTPMGSGILSALLKPAAKSTWA